LAVLAVVFIALFLFRPGVFGLRNRISRSIGNTLARRVTIDNVRLRVLPRPGFDLEGLVIYDDPAFSAEPMIRAEDVFAGIRLLSLLRGRLEISTLSATEPSINIVRSSDGRWNLASLIERNAQIPVGPTRKTASEKRPAFPYLEARGARINFKFGAEKKSYALVDGDVALWQESENSWGARLKADPVRTDFNLTDTGQVQLNATWQRAPTLHVTPMRVTVTWQKGQLGQITTLLTGKDRGWRGGVEITASLVGTPEALAIEGSGTIRNFHRYDILDERNVTLATQCAGNYNINGGLISGLLCESPAAGGSLRLAGDVGMKTSPRTYDLTLEAKAIPVATLVAIAQESKQQLPHDLKGEGSLEAEFHAVREGTAKARYSGTGEARNVRLLRSNDVEHAVELGNIPLAIVESDCCTQTRTRRDRSTKANREQADALEEPHLRLGPATMAVKTATAVALGGWVSPSGYSFFLHGDVNLKKLFALETMLGIPAAQPAADGAARVDTTITGLWQGLAAPISQGTAVLRNVHAETRALNAPIEIASATITFGDGAFSVDKVVALVGKTHWTGNIQGPRQCASDCKYQFDLSADRLSAGDLAEWFAPQPARRPWYRILAPDEKARPSSLLGLEARGTLRVGQFEMKSAQATEVKAELVANHGKITLANVRGQFLQGTHQGTWTINATARPIQYQGSGTLHNVSLDRLSDLMDDAWVSGKADGDFEVKTSGANFQEMFANAEGKLQFTMRSGAFTRLELRGASSAASAAASSAPTPVHRCSGDLQLVHGTWRLSGGRLESRDGFYEVSGTASSGQGIDFLFNREDGQSWNITGTLARPQAEEAVEEVSRSETRSKNSDKP
jgi:AsmA protein